MIFQLHVIFNTSKNKRVDKLETRGDMIAKIMTLACLKAKN